MGQWHVLCKNAGAAKASMSDLAGRHEQIHGRAGARSSECAAVTNATADTGHMLHFRRCSRNTSKAHYDGVQCDAKAEHNCKRTQGKIGIPTPSTYHRALGRLCESTTVVCPVYCATKRVCRGGVGLVSAGGKLMQFSMCWA